MNNRQVYLIAFLFFLLSVTILGYKVFFLNIPLKTDAGIQVWEVEVQVRFDARNKPVKVSLYLPETGGRFEVVNERFVSSDYGLAIQKFVQNRKAVWSIRGASGQQLLHYRTTVRPGRRVLPVASKTRPRPEAVSFTGAKLTAAKSVLETVRRQSSDAETMASLLIAELNGNRDQVRELLGENSTVLQRAEMSMQILGLGGIPARVVHGFELQALTRNAPRVHWVEVYSGGQWKGFNVNDASLPIPDHYLPWWRDNKPLLVVQGGENATARVSTRSESEAVLFRKSGASIAGESWLMKYSLLSLPIETQAVYHVLLSIPIGVLLLVVLRNLVGIKTFGTFMPVLIALAFRETQLLWGIALFTLVVGAGLVLRTWLERLKLLLVPRMATVMIMVIMIMAMISIISYRLEIPRGLSIALFPIVIMTMTIERMSIVWEERGMREALLQGSGSLFVAALAYTLMNIDVIQHFVFVFPEILFTVLAITVLLGRYSGYRLSELIRFRIFGVPQK